MRLLNESFFLIASTVFVLIGMSLTTPRVMSLRSYTAVEGRILSLQPIPVHDDQFDGPVRLRVVFEFPIESRQEEKHELWAMGMGTCDQFASPTEDRVDEREAIESFIAHFYEQDQRYFRVYYDADAPVRVARIWFDNAYWPEFWYRIGLVMMLSPAISGALLLLFRFVLGQKPPQIYHNEPKRQALRCNCRFGGLAHVVWQTASSFATGCGFGPMLHDCSGVFLDFVCQQRWNERRACPS